MSWEGKEGYAGRVKRLQHERVLYSLSLTLPPLLSPFFRSMYAVLNQHSHSHGGSHGHGQGSKAESHEMVILDGTFYTTSLNCLDTELCGL